MYFYVDGGSTFHIARPVESRAARFPRDGKHMFGLCYVSVSSLMLNGCVPENPCQRIWATVIGCTDLATPLGHDLPYKFPFTYVCFHLKHM
jgi:hypothetical protein